MTEAQTKSFIFPKNAVIEKFLNHSKKPEITISNILKKFGYPIFLLAGCLTSVHYAINPVGNARRMIVQSRMNPILLRVRHALPFVFLGLLYQYADQKFFYEFVDKRNQRNKIIEDFYKQNPDILRQ